MTTPAACTHYNAYTFLSADKITEKLLKDSEYQDAICSVRFGKCNEKLATEIGKVFSQSTPTEDEIPTIISKAFKKCSVSFAFTAHQEKAVKAVQVVLLDECVKSTKTLKGRCKAYNS